MIQFQEVTKKYGNETVLSGLTFEVEKGELVALIGPSGCGKTTLLKIVNRLIKPTSGDVKIGGVSIFHQDEIELRRGIGYVIQQTGLFPHMTVEENIEIVARLEKRDKKAIRERSAALMQMVGLEPDVYLKRYPFQLSGGQQQRIGVVRALALDPEVILMDEPFSALDPPTRLQLQEELADLQGKLRKTILFVTHDMDEAVKIADRICIMQKGAIVQYDTVEEIMKNPASEEVATFIGRNRIWSSPEFIRAKDIMISDPVCAAPEATVLRCIEKMRRRQVDSLMITDKDGRLMGAVTAAALQVVKDKQRLVRGELVREIETASPETNILQILDYVNGGKLVPIPVIEEDGRLVGLITRSSLLTTLSQQYTETQEVAQ